MLEVMEGLGSWLLLRPVVIAVAYALDLWLGDPFGVFHPVVWIGRLIGRLVHFYERRPIGERAALRAGRRLVLTVVTVSFSIAVGLLLIGYRLHIGIGLAIECWFAYQLLALRCLRDEAHKVELALKDGGVEAGRIAVGYIVGRDTTQLDEAGIVRATVETVAENTTDGVVAPLCYLLLGGLPLMVVYKAINTMDSMVGYQNERFLYLGRAAAKTDDAANFLPARLAALCMCAAAMIGQYQGREAWQIWRRDRRRHASPNSAQTEAVMAGALGVRLAGPAVYFGQRKEKPFIGDEHRAIEAEDIGRANRLLYRSAHIAVLICLLTAGGITVFGSTVW
ncbi:MAG: adenosylcobinamide-phosphate synthase CbiB [Eubacteriales bacterium]|nr:adenosylcobinamide-phosphate synthase CbiB [Eubacteriales bacterium]